MNQTEFPESQLEALFTRLDVGVFRATRDGKLLYANAAFLRMFGLTSPEAVDAWQLKAIAVCPIETARVLEEMRHRGRARIPDLEVRGPGGATMWIRLNQIQESFPGEADVIEGIIEDVTDRKNLDSEQLCRNEERIQAKNLESIGRLAGGVAHDFNNMLTAINGYSELLLGMLPEDNPLRENLVEIKKAGTRAAHLTRELLAFSRRQMLIPKVLDLNDLILSMDRFVRRAAGDCIDVELALDAKLGKIKCDPGQMENAIMNLVFNARDAMNHGGILMLRTANVEVNAYAALDRRIAHGNGSRGELPPGSYVSLTVSDTGSGMDSETLARVFEPFFTTKPMNKAAGMGLAMVYGIVKQSGGHIFAESEAGKGSFFRIYLPRIPESGSKRLDLPISE
ncbi:MAG: sensor hybrid histidine kinase [Fibrobacteres bacterium]|nr:sensor hybrid histidine kinase [Fibrobacterota bacterium]